MSDAVFFANLESQRDGLSEIQSFNVFLVGWMEKGKGGGQKKDEMHVSPEMVRHESMMPVYESRVKIFSRKNPERDVLLSIVCSHYR